MQYYYIHAYVQHNIIINDIKRVVYIYSSLKEPDHSYQRQAKYAQSSPSLIECVAS